MPGPGKPPAGAPRDAAVEDELSELELKLERELDAGDGEPMELEVEGDPGAAALFEGENLFDASVLEQETEAPPAAPVAPPEEGEWSSLGEVQGGFEVTDFMAGFDAGAGFATTTEVPYTGLALVTRELFAPIEEQLHGAAGGSGGMTVSESSEAECIARFAAGLVVAAKQHKVIPFSVKAAGLSCAGRPVLREARGDGTGLYRLHAAGVQTLAVVDGIDRAQAETLARVLLQRATGSGEDGDRGGDVARWFWEQGLTHVRLSILETFQEIEPLPETDLPVLEVPDQAAEQLYRLKSRLLAAVPGIAGSGERVTAVRNFTVSRDDLRALERDLLRIGAQLLGAPSRSTPVLPFPDLPSLDAELRKTLDASLQSVDSREVDALLQTAITLQDPARFGPVIQGLARRVRTSFVAGQLLPGIQLLDQLRAWADKEPGRQEKKEVIEAVLARTAAPDMLLPLLDRFSSLRQEEASAALLFLDTLPGSVVGTVGIAAARERPPPALVDYFRRRLPAQSDRLARSIAELQPEQAAGLLDGAVAVKSPQIPALVGILARREDPVLRQALARATCALPAAEAQQHLGLLLQSTEPAVRAAALLAIKTHPEAAAVSTVLLKAVEGFRYHEWLFAEKRAAMITTALLGREAAREPLRKIIRKQNPNRRRSLSETRAAALIALAAIVEPADDRLAGELIREPERKVVGEAIRALLQVRRGPPEAPELILSRLDQAFARFDDADGEGTADVAQEAAVREMSPHAVRAMRIGALLATPGDRVQLLGAALWTELARMLTLARAGETSAEAFLISVGRAANVAAALAEQLEGAVALQAFGGHFFVNAQRLRLPFAVYQQLAPAVEALGTLRIDELLFAEPPGRSDLAEMIYALITALKTEREPWDQLQREFTRIRLRQLSLIKESWGRPTDVTVDVRANAARLLANLILWLEDVGSLPDDHDLLPRRSERLVRELTDAQQEGELLLEGLLAVKSNQGEAALLAAHAVLLAATLARWLGCRRDQLAALIRCAMHAQLGLLSLPRQLLEDLGAESPHEAGELLRVPLYGAARIAAAANAGQDELRLALVMAFESQAPLSGTGPAGRRSARPQTLAHSRLFAVAQRYVFLTSSFPRRPALAPDAAIAAMLGDPELDGRIVRALANRAGILPAGARVRLSDGREAVVVAAPLRPVRADPLVLRVVSEGAAVSLALSGEAGAEVEIAEVLEAETAAEVAAALEGLLH